VRFTIPLLLMLPCLLALSGCVRLATEREIVWARMGTPARIVDKRPIAVLVADGEGGWVPGEAVLQGMVALDEPTLTYYQRLDAEGARP
jgi:hypothetical protein